MKTIIITGANGNLGTAAVKKFLDENYKVIGVDSKNNHLGFALDNTDFSFHSLNLSNEDETSRFANDMINKYGSIDGALMLVGGFAMGNTEVTTGDDLEKMFALNFETAFFLARPLLQHMKRNKYGRLIFIGARPALKAEDGKNMIAYALTKSLLFKLAEFINEDAKGMNVTASVVVPSTIDTEINRKAMPEANPDHWVRPEKIAEVLEFICSDKSSVIREGIYKVYNNA